MSILAGFFTYLIVWWTVLFAVLPWGNRQPENPEQGMAYGAPVNPNIKKKLIATTIVSFIVLGIIYACITMNIIDFREVAREMDAKIYGDRAIHLGE
jgi:predicted secreted protein